MGKSDNVHRLSVIVPQNPFSKGGHDEVQHCLCALNVEDLMNWWPGTPHTPHRRPEKVRAIQRSLDWKRVANIAAYLLQREIDDVPARIESYFKEFYEPKKGEPGREWPPKIKQVFGFEPSEFPTFSNVLLHVNGAKVTNVTVGNNKEDAAKLTFDASHKGLNFSVIDGQHRINGAFFAIKYLQDEGNKKAKWEIPAEIFLDLDEPDEPPRKQAQIFIDVNFYQKKVDRSLVADLYPTTRSNRDALDDKERAQDIGRRLMLETGPLVGMIQIPGIRYGVKDVITLATLNAGIEDILPSLREAGVTSLGEQTSLIANCLSLWLEATGRREDAAETSADGMEFKLNPENVVYQGRILISVLNLIPAMLWYAKKKNLDLFAEEPNATLLKWLKGIAERAGLLVNGKFMDKSVFREKGFLGSGGIGRFRDALWAAIRNSFEIKGKTAEDLAGETKQAKAKVFKELAE